MGSCCSSSDGARFTRLGGPQLVVTGESDKRLLFYRQLLRTGTCTVSLLVLVQVGDVVLGDEELKLRGLTADDVVRNPVIDGRPIKPPILTDGDLGPVADMASMQGRANVTMMISSRQVKWEV